MENGGVKVRNFIFQSQEWDTVLHLLNIHVLS